MATPSPVLQKPISNSATGSNGSIYEDPQANFRENEHGCCTCFKVYKRRTHLTKMAQEYQVMKCLNDEGVPGIPRVFELHGAISVGNRSLPAIRMERFDGPDLQTYLNEQAQTNKVQYYKETRTTSPFFSEHVVFDVICLKLMETLKKLHEIGAHRDIKLENLILVKDANQWDVKLIDFDFFVYNVQKRNPASRKMKGTMLYASPEELRHESEGQPSDIWAVGICVLVLLGQMDIINHPQKTKRGQELPFFSPNYVHTPEAFTNSMVRERIERLAISENHKTLLSEMLNANPMMRPDAATICSRLLSPSLSPATVVAHTVLAGVLNSP